MATAIELSPVEIQGLCQRYLQNGPALPENSNFEVLSYKLKPMSDAPVGFLGRHLFLNIEICLQDAQGKGKVQKLCFFSKTAPSDITSHMEYIEEFGVFKKEILVYRDVLPALQVIFPDVAPKCYYADNNLLVFENLTEQGYRMAAGRDGLLNYEHLNCLLKSLAALHADSIVYEVRAGKKFTELHPQAVVENSYPKNTAADHVRLTNFNNASTVIKEIITTMSKYTAKLEYILERFPRCMSRIFDLAATSTRYRNVFSHGDLWANNIMFQYGKFGEIPIQCRFVDFQLARYAPPMLDLITVLTIPTSRRFRKQHLQELLCDYYCFLSEFLKREGEDIANHLPQSEYKASFEEFRIAGLIESLLFSHLTILPPESTQELTTSTDGFSEFFNHKRVEICMEVFHTDAVYRERLTDMIEDFVDNFVLK